MVADSLVHHPALAHYQRLAATTVGRDKLLRVVQYFARFYAWYLFRTNGTPGEVAPWESLKAKLGLVRKVLRAGKGAEHLKEAALLADDPKLADPVLKYAAVGRQLGYAGYLTLDLLTLPAAVGFWPATERTKRIQRQAYQFWAYGLACSVVAGAYKLYRLREREARVDRKEGDGAVESKRIAMCVPMQGGMERFVLC
jgi:peroxin-11B